MTVYIPFYKRSPNKFIEYETKRFDHGKWLTGTVIVAHFFDKNGKKKQVDAFIKWDHPDRYEKRLKDLGVSYG